jgi:hypothetical protein
VVWWVVFVVVPLSYGWSLSTEKKVLPLLLAASPGGCAFLVSGPHDDMNPWLPAAIAIAVQFGFAAVFVKATS